MNRIRAVSSKVVDLIGSGDKISAVAAVRQELGCSLLEAKAIVDEYDEHLGANPAVPSPQKTGAPIKPSRALGSFLFLLLSGKSPFRFLRALRHARKHSIDIDCETLCTHQLVGDSLILIHGIQYARTKAIPHTTMRIAAAQLKLESSQKLHQWIDQGLPNFE